MAYTIFVFVASLIKINKHVGIKISHFDKLVHIGIYFIFTILWFMYFINRKYKQPLKVSVLKAIGLAFVVGVIIEFLQELNPNARSGDVKDVIANTIGILIAVLFVRQIKKYHTLNSTK